MAIARTAAGTVSAGTGSVDLGGASFLIIGWWSTVQNPTATFDSVGLTRIYSLQSAWSTSYENFYYLNSPHTGSKTLAVSNYGGGGAVAYIGLSGTSGLDNQNSATGAVSSVTVAPVASNCWTCAYWNGTNTVNLSGGPNTFEAGNADGVGLGDSEATVSGSQTQNFTGAGTSSCNLYMVTVAPTGGVVTTIPSLVLTGVGV